MGNNTEQIYARIKKGKYKNKIGVIQEGLLDEDHLIFPLDWYERLDERELAKELIGSMINSQLNGVLSHYLNISDASNLISKYMSEFGIREFQGGCCG
jgi:hypothetical protein